MGILVIQDSLRLSRRPLEAELILQRAIRHHVLIHMGGRLFDPANAELHELLNIRVQNLLAWVDNENRVRNLTAAKLAKTRHGHAVTRPPRGYVISVRGAWVKDELPVREAVDRIFQLYPRLGSIRKVVAYFDARGWEFPVRSEGVLQWKPISPMQVAHILRCPLYTGRLMYRRMKVHDKSESGKRWVECLPVSEWIFAQDDKGVPVIHHEPYISWDDFMKIQAMLSNQRVRKHPPILNGMALLQGLLWCAGCNRAIRTVYQLKMKGRRYPSYVCRPSNREGQIRRCFRVPSGLLDNVLVREILSFLPKLDAASLRTIIRGAEDEAAASERTRARQLARYEAEEAEARKKYQAIQDPAHSLVRLQLETDYEAALARTRDYRQELATKSWPASTILHPDDADKLAELLQRVQVIWDAGACQQE